MLAKSTALAPQFLQALTFNSSTRLTSNNDLSAMNTMRKAMAGILAAALCAGGAMAGEVTRTISDLNTPGEWVEYQWNGAKGRLAVRPEFPEELKGKGGEESSLGVKTTWPGGEGMKFCSIVPANPAQTAVPFKLLRISLWVKGAGSGHHGEIHFTANGQEKGEDGKIYKVAFKGPITWTDWRKLDFEIPSDWPQPVAVKSITLHSWGRPESVETTTYFTRLEATCDSDQKAGAQKAKSGSNDNW
jgi:hypothetical protein